MSSPIFKLFGLNISYDVPENHRMMILDRPWFLFGSDLTQQFQGAMVSERSTKLIPANQEPVFYFSSNGEYFKDKKRFVKMVSPRTLGRGMVCLNMGNPDKVLEVASFIKTYQMNTGLLIGSLEEIAWHQKNISSEQIAFLSKQVPYGDLLNQVIGKPQVDCTSSAGQL